MKKKWGWWSVVLGPVVKIVWMSKNRNSGIINQKNKKRNHKKNGHGIYTIGHSFDGPWVLCT